MQTCENPFARSFLLRKWRTGISRLVSLCSVVRLLGDLSRGVDRGGGLDPTARGARCGGDGTVGGFYLRKVVWEIKR